MGRRLLRAVLVISGVVVFAVQTGAGGVQAASQTVGPLPLVPMRSPAGNLVTGPRDNGTAVLPDGRVVTPVGKTILVDLLPLNAVLSHDGRRLYVTSEGGDDEPSKAKPGYDRVITVVDTTTMKTTRVDDDAIQYGLVESPDGKRVYVSEGEASRVGVFEVRNGTLVRKGAIQLTAGAFPWGLAVSPNGRYVYAVGFRDNSLYVIDTTAGAVVARVPTGQFPYGVAASPDGKSVYVSNWGLFNPNDNAVTAQAPVDLPPLTIGGYNTTESSSVWKYDVSNPIAAPVVSRKTRIGPDIDGVDVISGSLPSSLALSRNGATLAVTSSNTDRVLLFSTATGALLRTIDLRVFGAAGPTGAQPNAVSWSPDGSLLYVAEGGRNTVALIDAATGGVRGRLPTGWYPSAVVPTPDGTRLFVASAKGFGAGANGVEIEPVEGDGSNRSYIGNLLKGTVQSIELTSACGDLAALTSASDAANGFVRDPSPPIGVVPAAYGQRASSAIKHVVFILKENRTYDQVLSDVAGTERDHRLGLYTMPVTPNHHAAATGFAHGDNFYDVGQDSFDGHFIITSGHENEFDQKVHPTVWNANKLSPENIYVSAPENLPIEGFMWNNLDRHNVSFRIYGEATFLLGLGPTTLVPPNAFATTPNRLLPQSFALENHYSLTYPSQITPSRPAFGDGNTDEDRADDFLRELPILDAANQVPQFMFLWLTDDHTQGASPGAPTPEYLVARNDHALGRILDGLTHSRAWNDMAVFVTEDDPQDGQDHVDAHRTLQLVLSPYAKRHYVSHVHHSNMSALKTINLLLGVPPTSIQEASSTAMTDYFTTTPQLNPRYSAQPQQVPLATNPTPAAAGNAKLADAARLQESVPPGLDEGGEDLQEVLRLRHDGAAAAGEPGIPQLTDTVERRLAVGEPSPVKLSGRKASCTDVAAAGATQPGPLPVTGGTDLLPGLLLLAAAAALRPVSRRGRRTPAA
ncbi:MAG TPA: beta-propeller fold lactonase family protein [Acidimicrobiales bacterium]|nr:beta-propeller fold lactonase family protein [Acidimicrobiales bacterium]